MPNINLVGEKIDAHGSPAGSFVPLDPEKYLPGKKPFYADEYCAVYHGDASLLMPRMTSNSIDLLWTDPPYGHGNHDGDLNDRLNQHRGIESKPIANDDRESFRELFDFVLLEAARVLKSDCCCCCCCGGGGGPTPAFAWMANRLDEKGFSFFHAVVWNKLNPGLGWKYRRQYEMIMVAHLKGGRLLWPDNDKTSPNLFSISPPRDRCHPNEKPIELPSHFINLHTTKEHVILDPFMGSGTTLIAAKALGRKCIGIELDESFCDVAVKKLRQEYLPL